MSKHSAIEIQISARVRLPRGWTLPAESVIRSAIQAKAHNPSLTISGIDLRIVRWRHGSDDDWIEPSARKARDAWEHFARFLHSASVSVHTRRQIRSR